MNLCILASNRGNNYWGLVDICEAYKGATDQQKQIIVDTISNMVLDGHPVDANVLVKIGELSGKNLIDIEPLEEE